MKRYQWRKEIEERLEKEAVLGIMSTLLLVGMFAVAFNVQPAKASGTIYVREDGSIDPPTALIQRNGDTYTFADNIYDSIVIQRSNVIIDGSEYMLEGVGTGNGFDLSNVHNVTIRRVHIARFEYGIMLYGSTLNNISLNEVSNNSHAIVFFYSNNNAISNNTIANNEYSGIYLHDSVDNVLERNTISGTRDGVVLRSFSNSNIIGRNTITNATGFGIELTESNNNNITANSISDDGWGISLSLYDNNNIISQNIVFTNQLGIYLFRSDGNLIYQNDFVNNWLQVSSSFATNVWDYGYPSGGNHWSDYNGSDSFHGPYQNVTGGDGIGDTPYLIDENNQDNYPLLTPYEYWSNPIRGDINRDTRVNYDDLFSLATAYGSTPEKPNWNPNADVNGDGRVNYKDLYLLAINYGKTYP